MRPTSYWLWLLVALQVAIPASYYLLREDRDDERFAWRMFSVIRLRRCTVRARELDARGGEHPIDLESALHASWVRSLERGRRAVARGFLARRCALSQAAVTELVRDCSSPAGDALPTTSYRYECASERFEVTP